MNLTLFDQVPFLKNRYTITDVLYFMEEVTGNEDGFAQRR